MTLIRFNFEKPSASGEDVPNEGSLRLVPTMRRVVEGDPDVVILPAPFSVKVSGSLGLELAATGPGWVWDLRASGFGVSSWQEFLVVPEPVVDPDRPGEFLPVDYPDLVRVDPATLEPTAAPDPAWWAALEAAKALASDVEAARVAAAGSAVEAGTARDDAVVAAGEASGFAGDAAGSASAAVAAAGSAGQSADTATARAGEASAARTGAESARDATVAAAGGSEASAAQAAGAAVDSAQSAADANAAAQDVVARADSGEFDGDSLAMGAVTALPAGSTPTATITGTSPNKLVNFGLVAGSPTAFELRGTGSPVGVVAAPPGTYYTDAVGTTGAWRWLKKSGNATAGWAVVEGDTGWRNLGAIPGTAVSAGNIKIRRVNDTVELLIDGLMWNNVAPGRNVLTAGMDLGAPGFGTGSPAIRSLLAISDADISFFDNLIPYLTGSGSRMLYLRWVSRMGVAGFHTEPVTSVKPLSGSLVWTTTAGWPTIYPGTPN